MGAGTYKTATARWAHARAPKRTYVRGVKTGGDLDNGHSRAQAAAPVKA